ncbi:MAG: sulfite exporter TauE/SafE family protein [Gemmatimonadaceae bacterium]|nr:sulfite exporter TauE/SafE family protein [Gemmatimonadaceae bacterium]MCW5827119.1 sulfite exporter TauE/SafE family protein [Gemmatimonadaceae bacterium]
MTAIAAALALAIGVTLGLLGAGGSILTVPVLVLALGVHTKTAIAMGLPIVGGAALVGVVQHYRHGNVNFRVAIPFGLAAMLGAYGGAIAARHLSGHTQLRLLAVVMLVAAVLMFRNSALPERPIATPRRRILMLVGVAAGSLTGLVGVGGGFLLVPALVLLAGVSMHQAVGTSLFVIVLNTLAGYAGYHSSVHVPWDLVAWFAGFTAAGLLVGTAFATRVPHTALKRAFAALLVAVAIYLLIKG